MEQKVKYVINLISENGQVVVSSREVAENFGKEHRNVMRDVENIMSQGVLKNEQTQLQNRSFLKNSTQIARKTAF